MKYLEVPFADSHNVFRQGLLSYCWVVTGPDQTQAMFPTLNKLQTYQNVHRAKQNDSVSQAHVCEQTAMYKILTSTGKQV